MFVFILGKLADGAGYLTSDWLCAQVRAWGKREESETEAV